MPSPDHVREVLASEQLVEYLAAIGRECWAHWQRYVHDQCEHREDGSLVIPAELAARWEAQIETPYAELPEQEKGNDREQVRRYLPTMVAALTERCP